MFPHWKACCTCDDIFDVLTESSKSPTSNAQSIKWRVGTYLYQMGYKPHLINCEAVIRL